MENNKCKDCSPAEFEEDIIFFADDIGGSNG